MKYRKSWKVSECASIGEDVAGLVHYPLWAVNLKSDGTGTNPSSEAYQKLMKESASLLPLVYGYQQLQQLHAEVGLVMAWKTLVCCSSSQPSAPLSQPSS